MDFSMESSDHWLQGTNIIDDVEECGIMDSLCSSPPIVERRVRPPQDQALKCPRCESTNTKFCYYNNYSLSQPRYFCKTCRRYWTKGGTLRNIPVGGGCRKNKKVSNKKSTANDVVPLPLPQHRPHDHDHDLHDLQLHQAMQFSHPMGVGLMLDQFHAPFEFVGGINMINGTTSSRDFDHHHHHHQGFDINGHIHNNNGLLLGPNFQGLGGTLCSFDDAYNNVNDSGTYVMDSSSSQQRQMLPHDDDDHHHHNDGNEDQNVGAIHDVKPNPKILALEWQDQGCSDVGKQPFGGYMSGLGSWTGMINGYGSSTTNSFV